MSEFETLKAAFDNYGAFVTLACLALGSLGLIGRSMAMGAFGAFVLFGYIAVSTGNELHFNILVVSLVLMFVGIAFKLWRLEGAGE